MALRLRVVSEHATRLGEQSTKVFGVHGGTIGRSTNNEWILPDPERYLSGKHIRIDFRAGNYILVDTSSNGTYVNGAQVPLGKYHDYQLREGDYVRLGEYELLVSIDKSNDFPPDDSSMVAYANCWSPATCRPATPACGPATPTARRCSAAPMRRCICSAMRRPTRAAPPGT